MNGENTMITKNKSGAKIPVTGRIGRFAKILMAEVDQEILEKIMRGSDKYNSFNPVKQAEWWKEAIEQLEKELDKEKVVQIMKACGQKCCGQGHRKTVKKLMSESKSINEFLDKLNENYKGVSFKLKNKNTVIVEYDKCFCGQVKQTKEPFSTDTYCQCGAEWEKQFFEVALEKPVEVELVQSVITGAKSCKFIIHI